MLYSLEHLHASSVASSVGSSVMASSVILASADTIPTTSSATDIKEKDQLREPPAVEAAKEEAQAEADAGFSRTLVPLI